MTQKLKKLKKNIPDHGIYITTKEFNNLTAVNLAARLKKATLASKKDIADLDGKLKKVLKKLLQINKNCRGSK